MEKVRNRTFVLRFDMAEISVIEHIHSMQLKWSPTATGQFTSLLHDLILSAKIISRSVTKAGLVDILGGTGNINIQGEQVQKLDDFANSVMIYRMKNCGVVCALGSEEEEELVIIDNAGERGNYVIFFDPLDGSSNIEANVSIGTIFSIYRVDDNTALTKENILRKGSEQVAAGYFLYGPSTMLVYSTGHGVYGFTLDPSVGEFLLSHENIKIPETGKYYSVNAANYDKWAKEDQKAVDMFTHGGYSLRYVGSLVADFHRTLLYGGIYSYPADMKNKNGKLRLLYEANPLSFLMEQAGGLAVNGQGNRILETMPEHVHMRTPFIFGSVREVEKYRSAFG